MKRLHKENLNKPDTHIKKPPNWFDVKRFKLLWKYYKKGDKALDLGSYTFFPQKEFDEAIEKIDWIPEIIPRNSNSYDYVVAGQLLEHLEKPKQFIQEVYRILKPNGIFALSVPLKETSAGEVDKIYHIWSFSIEDIKKLLKNYKNVKIKIIGSQYFPKYKYHFPHIVAWAQKYDDNNSFNLHSLYWSWLTWRV